MLEATYQRLLKKRLKLIFEGCIVLKQDAELHQGIPDLIVLFEDKWAALEVKASYDSPFEANQEYYLEVMDNMSFAAMICPENEDEVLNELQRAFGFGR